MTSSGRGFGLIESLVALLVLTITVVVVMRHERRIANEAANARQRAEAAWLAHESLEMLRAGSAAADSFAAPPDAIEGRDTPERNGTRYERRWAQGAVQGQHRAAFVDVEWTGIDGRTRTLRLHSLVSASDATDAVRLARPAPEALSWPPR